VQCIFVKHNMMCNKYLLKTILLPQTNINFVVLDPKEDIWNVLGLHYSSLFFEMCLDFTIPHHRLGPFKFHPLNDVGMGIYPCTPEFANQVGMDEVHS